MEYLVFSALRSRASLVTEFQAKLAILEENEARDKATLLALAPPHLHQLIKEQGLLNGLFQYGWDEVKVYNADLEAHGFKNRKQLFEGLRQLKEAWKDNVIVDIGTKEAGIIRARLTPVPTP